MKEDMFDYSSPLYLILEDAKIAWWIRDFQKQTITLSRFAQKLMGIESDEISYTDFVSLVRKDYRDRITQALERSGKETVFNRTFPIQPPKGLLWIHSKDVKQADNDSTRILGYAQVIEDPEATSLHKANFLRANNLLHQLNSLSGILLSFLETDDTDKVINDMLREVLKQFKAGRTYIIEYDWKNRTQTNTYEVTDSHIKPEIDLINKLSMDLNPWWTEQIRNRKTISLSTLDDLPPEAQAEKEFLDFQNINSLFVVPLISLDGVWGYAGIDIVEGFHTWTDEDHEWITAIINIIGICIQLQRSEKETLTEKTYLQNLYKNMPLAYLRINVKCDSIGKATDFSVVDANTFADDLFQRPLTQLIGTPISQTPIDLQETLTYINQALQNKEYFRSEYHIQRSDKHTQFVIYSIVKNELVCLFSDVTEYQHTKEKLIEAKEKAEVSDKLKSAFLANMSHEIRTPLNAIVGFSDLLIDSESKEERQYFSKLLNENNELLLQLISDILDISKIEAGTLDIVNNVINVNELCTEIMQYYRIKTKDNVVKVSFDEQLPSCFVYGDKNRITQIFNNFINNALKFTKEGGISLGYQIYTNDTIKFYVKDTGCGIPSSDFDSVFQRFTKLNTFATGTGLGLAICKSLIEQMGGEIGVDSELGKGSCFWFTLPYLPELTAEIPVRNTPHPVVQSPTNKRFKILIAEDTESNFVLLERILKEQYDLNWAKDGMEAIELFERSKPDIILMDIRMPNINGIEAIQTIREMNKEIPIIAVTAFTYDSDVERVLKAGCNAYISKPIRANDLLSKIVELIQ